MAARYAERVPYRVDIRSVAVDAFDRLVELGAIDAECLRHGEIAAIMPDTVEADQVASALGVGVDTLTVSPVTGRDDGSVWVLSRRPIRIGRLTIVPAHTKPEPAGALQLIDSAAFGTGLHPTTVLCLEVLEEHVRIASPNAVLDVGTGSGVLALGALVLGVPRALAVDIDEQALRVAAENARINAISERLELRHGGPEAATGTWPMVLANVLPAPLIEMAPTIVKRVGHHGLVVLSGIPSSVEPDVEHAYRRLGMRRMSMKSRAGWVALVMQASW
jgi:ribosomal protein L11 methyltransferase